MLSLKAVGAWPGIMPRESAGKEDFRRSIRVDQGTEIRVTDLDL